MSPENSIKSKVKKFLMLMPFAIHDVIYGALLRFFKSVNRKAGKNLALWYLKCETFVHVNLLTKVFKWVVLPTSFLHICLGFFLFRKIAWDSMFLGILIFIYSNFLPDLPSINYKKKIYYYKRESRLSWYKESALLLFAPLFIGALFLGIRLRGKTAETFHNVKSLAVYGAFLLTLSIFLFGDFPTSVGNITEIISLPFYGLAGYLTHLKADLVF
ncbi:MAG: hypothetical protein ACFFDT_31400 [Candidatus Hodarchaeota archaeon]